MVLALMRSKKFKKNILIALLVLIIPAFVLWGVGSMSGKPQLVGEIGKHKIYADAFENSRKGLRIQILLAYFQDANTINKIFQNRSIVNSMTWERLVYLDAARKDGVKVSNADVRSFIASHPLFSRNGVFDQKAYDYLLRSTFSMDARTFEEFVRQNLMVRNFRQKLIQGVAVSDEEALDFFNKTNGKADLSYVVVKKDSYADQAKPTEEEIKKFYDDNKDRIYSPPRVTVEYLEIPYEDAAGKAAAEKTLAGAYPDLVKDPERFLETAKAKGLKTGETKPFSREEVIQGLAFSKDFHDAAFTLQVGEVSQPIFSSPERGSAFILRKKQDFPSRKLSFDEVKNDIAKLIADHKALNMAAAKADELYKKLSASEITLDAAATELGETVRTAAGLSYKDYLEGAGQAQDAVMAALGAGEGKFIPPVTAERGALIARVDKITSADKAAFEKDKETITKNLLMRKQMAALDNWLAQNTMQVKLAKPIEEM